jgi:K+-transporting ATPase ATPase C chain
MRSQLLPAVRATLVLAILTGLAFPLAITAAAQGLFPQQANGSLVRNSRGEVIGSALLGQSFTQPRYFHPRPSAAGAGYDATLSGGTNLGPTSAKLIQGVDDDPATSDTDESFAGVADLVAAYRSEHGLAADTQVPVDAVTRSASGLDPHISVANARLQAPRVARARGLAPQQVAALVESITEPRQFGLLGEPRVNVLRLNLALDAGG